MEVFLTHRSALEYWRIHGTAQQKAMRRHRRQTAPVYSPDATFLRQADIQGLTLPLDITVRTMEARRPSHLIRPHMLQASLPEGSMISIGDGLYVGSPNLCFLQMANRLAFPKLLELGFELCGTYALPVPGAASEATDASQTSLYNRKPLTSKKSLIAFAEQMAGVSGAKAALKALHSIADSSASPMETILTILLTLPFRYGGYGFPLPEMNAKIRPAKTAKQNSNQSLYICDLYWPDVEVVAEYDSDTYHTGSDRISHDSQKRNSLEAMGVTVVTVTNRQISSIMQFEKVAKQIAVNMGRRMQYENPQFTQAQLQLRRTLGL